MSDRRPNLEHVGGSIQKLAADELLQRLAYFALEPQRVLDLGSGRCRTSTTLQQRFAQAQILAFDPSWEALNQAGAPGWFRRRRYQRVCAAIGALPLREHSIDLVLSHLLLPRWPLLEVALCEIARVLRPGGVLLFSSAQADFGDIASEPAPDLAGWGQLLLHAGFSEPVMDVERHRITYRGVEALTEDLAAAAIDVDRSTAPSVTYELIAGAAFAARDRPDKSRAPASGEVLIPLGSVARKPTS
jgi:malonyl-CoA O-methyltransferase